MLTRQTRSVRATIAYVRRDRLGGLGGWCGWSNLIVLPEAGATMDHVVRGCFPSGVGEKEPPAVQLPRLHLQVEQRASDGDEKKVARTHRHGVYLY